MSTNKMIGIALILVGAGLAFWGYDMYNSVGSTFGSMIGEAPIKAYALMGGGVVAIVLGILKVK